MKEVRKLGFPKVGRFQTLGRLAVQPLLDVLGSAIRMDPDHGTPAADIDSSFSWRREGRRSRNDHSNAMNSRIEKLPHPPFLSSVPPTVRKRTSVVPDQPHFTTAWISTAKPKTTYRSRFRIYVDIIRLIQREGDQAKPTRILNHAKLSHDRLIKYLDELEALKVIQESDSYEKTYGLTQKGLEFIHDLREIEAYVQAFGFKL